MFRNKMKNYFRFFLTRSVLFLLLLGIPHLITPQSVFADGENINWVFIPTGEKVKENRFSRLINVVEKLTGYNITSRIAKNYNTAVSVMRSGEAQIAFLGGNAYIKASQTAGAIAFAVGIPKGKESASYNSLFEVQADSPIKTLADVRGSILGLNLPGSTSGDLIPQLELQKIGLSLKIRNHFINVVYTGSHDTCLQSVLLGQVDVCGLSSINFNARLADGTFSRDQVRILSRSDPIPPPPLVYSKRLPQSIREKIKKAVLSAHKHGVIDGYGGIMDRYISITDADYDILRRAKTLLHKNKTRKAR